MLHIHLCKIFILYLHRCFEVQANVLTLGNSKWDAMSGSWEEGSMKQGKCRVVTGNSPCAFKITNSWCDHVQRCVCLRFSPAESKMTMVTSFVHC